MTLSVLCIACGSSEPQTTPVEPTYGGDTFGSNFRTVDEAESLLGITLLLPEYVPAGLERYEDVAILEDEAAPIGATIFYRPDPDATTPTAFTVIYVIEWTKPQPDREFSEEIMLGGTRITLGSYEQYPEEYVTSAYWAMGERAFEISATGSIGSPEVVLRDEVLMIVKSILNVRGQQGIKSSIPFSVDVTYPPTPGSLLLIPSHDPHRR